MVLQEEVQRYFAIVFSLIQIFLYYYVRILKGVLILQEKRSVYCQLKKRIEKPKENNKLIYLFVLRTCKVWTCQPQPLT